MRIEPAHGVDIQIVAKSMRERDFAEFRALFPAETRDQLAGILKDRYAGRDDVFCAWKDRQRVAIGAAMNLRPNVVGLLFFANGMFSKISAQLTKFILRDVFPSLLESGVHRIEAITLADYPASARWLEGLGLEFESAVAGYGRHGETFNIHAWVSDAVRAPSNP